jgi:triacylglycerol lipase
MSEVTRGWSARRALLLLAVLSQAYAQYKRPAGPIVLPHPYRMTAAIAGKAYADDQTAFAFLVESERDAVLAFRGTIRTDEWVSDAMARQIACPFDSRMGWTHAGFTDIYESMRGKIAEALETIASAKPLFIAGHSLGGALAVLAAAELASGGRQPVVYTFGAPRAGSPRFACRYDKLVPDSYRVANPHDIVTRLPPPIWWSPRTNAFYFYRHVRTRIGVAFRSGRRSGNHSLRGYFRSLALQDPAYAASLWTSVGTDED